MLYVFYVNILLNIIIIFKKFITNGVAVMRKPFRKTFNQLVNENKQSLLRNKEEIEKIERK
ncbi:FbpB family small basic protein, partial [Gottfriedia acidiceleris]|uniref:FbpB family small basic protein n=1 Tax=Gottfriedia acidiceleris TaxID=371036 RepID=UPI003B589F69